MSKRKKPASEEEAKDNTKRVKFNQSCKVMLTTEEIADRADRAASMIADRDNKELELKSQTKHAKSVIEQIDSEMRMIQGEVRTKSTYKQVECQREYVFNEGIYREVRLDTGEIIMSRKLLESERQMELPFEDQECKGSVHTKSWADAQNEQEATITDESWRLIPIQEALPGLGVRTNDAFEKAKIETMGDFSDFQAKHGEFWVYNLDGVAAAGAEKIADAAEKFWAGRK